MTTGDISIIITGSATQRIDATDDIGQESGTISDKTRVKNVETMPIDKSIKSRISSQPGTGIKSVVDRDSGKSGDIGKKEGGPGIGDKKPDQTLLKQDDPILKDLENAGKLMDAVVDDAKKEMEKINVGSSFLKSLDEVEEMLGKVVDDTVNEPEDMPEPPGRKLPEKLAAAVDKLLTTKGNLPNVAGNSPKAANMLMATAANAKDLAVDILDAYKDSFPAELKNKTRQEISAEFLRLPLARLPVAVRHQVVQLRELHQSCMLSLNGIADSAEGETAAKLLAERSTAASKIMQEADEALAKCNKFLDKHTGIADYEKIRAVLNLVANPPRGKIITTSHPAIQSLMAGLPKTTHNSIESIFRRFLQDLACIRAQLPQGGLAGRSRLAMQDLDVSAKNELDSIDSINDGLQLLHVLSNGVPIADSLTKEYFRPASKTFTRIQEPGISIKPGLPPPPSEALQRLVDGIVQSPGTGKVLTDDEVKNMVSSITWRLEQTLRGDIKNRIMFALAPNPMAQIKNAVERLPLGNFDAGHLVGKLTDLVNKYIILIPSASKEDQFDSGGFGALINLTIDGKEVLAKKNVSEKKPQIDSFAREMVLHDIFQNNPNVPKIIGIGSDKAIGRTQGDLYLVMEKVPGKNLSKYITMPPGPTGVEEAPDNLFLNLPYASRNKAVVHLLRGAVLGLAPMHEAGFGHFDIKPQNIMLDSNTMEARLIDFGLTAEIDAAIIVGGGTSGYGSDEGMGRRIPAEDVYALGITFMQMACGEHADIDIKKVADKDSCQVLLEEPVFLLSEMRGVRDIGRILTNPEPGDRPTTQQLKDIFTKGTLIPALEGEDGVKGADAKRLLELLAPDGPLAGGREVLASIMQ